MSEDRYLEDLRPLRGSIEPDYVFAEQLFEELSDDLGFRSSTRTPRSTRIRRRSTPGSRPKRIGRRSHGSERILALAAAIVIAVLVGSRFVGPFGVGGSSIVGPTASIASSRSASEFPSAPLYPQVAGTYVTTLDGTDPAVSDAHLAGSWTMTLRADGAVDLTAPATFQAGVTQLSGISFSLNGDAFTTNLFFNIACNSVATYTWNRAGTRLTFTPVNDTCSTRRMLLAATWITAP